MKKLPDRIVQFFRNQGFVIVSTIDRYGSPHNSCKGIVKINGGGRVYLLDLYKGQTYENLNQNPNMSVTYADEHSFSGYCLKGKARVIPGERLKSQLIKAWEDRITGRITQRLLKNVYGEKGHPLHPEAHLPKPKYLIVMEVEDIVDLTPHPLKEKE